jgi:hypothetical protein
MFCPVSPVGPFILLVFAALAWPLAAHAVDPEPVLDVNAAEIEEMLRGEREGDPTAHGLLALPADAVPKLSPLMQEIREALVDEQTRADVLHASIEEAYARRDAEQVLVLQRRLEQVRREAESQIVRIQIRQAIERGDDEVVRALEAQLEEMNLERIVGNPKERTQPRN